MSKFCCITDLIRFMMNEAENLMKGSVHEDDFFIAHVALVLMTAKDTIEWMKEKNCYHRWLLPMNGLQDGTPYAELPVGNSPEFIPLDNSLNRDILNSLRFHCVLSHLVLDGEGTDKEERNIQFSFPYEAYMGIENGNPFFGANYRRCGSGIEGVGNCLPGKWGYS